MKKYCFNKRLPKSSLLKIRRSYIKAWFWKGYTVRIANAREFYWLGFNATIRAPWLMSSAKALHPELFK